MAGRLVFLTMLVALALTSWLAGCPGGAPRQQAEGAPTVAPHSTPHQWLGGGSCASMGCHNANGLKGDLHSEYTTWIVYDPHARGYEVLFNNKSRSIVKNLQLEGNQPAPELPLCLNCHVHKDYELANHHPRFAKEDGVGCESCHGPAGGWVGEHYKPHWAALTPEQKNQQGMWDTRSLTGRVRGCTPCHVGTPRMEVNHDLLAAGHPRLAFEFSAYHALLPHHWQDAKDKQARPDWDAAAWFVGQTITTQAAVELLAARAGAKVWPEFAEYDCYACHHQLQNQNWRQNRDFTARQPGKLPWNDWYLSSLPYRIQPGKPNAAGLLSQIAKLRGLMENKVAPDSKAVSEQADKVVKALGPWVRQFSAPDARYAAEDLAVMIQQLANSGATRKAGSWDEAAQTYLAVVAIYQALRDVNGPQARPPDLQDALKKIRGNLQFTSDSDSPPVGYTPDLLLEPYKLLRKRLGS